MQIFQVTGEVIVKQIFGRLMCCTVMIPSIETLCFLPQNAISVTGTSFTPMGVTQYAFFCVTVIESLIRTPLSIAKRRDVCKTCQAQPCNHSGL